MVALSSNTAAPLAENPPPEGNSPTPKAFFWAVFFAGGSIAAFCPFQTSTGHGEVTCCCRRATMALTYWRPAWLLCCLLFVSAQDVTVGPLVDFSKEYPERLNEELILNVIAGDFVLEAELGLETNFEDIDRVLRGTLGQICQHAPMVNAPVTVERFLDMASLVLRRKAFRYKWWLLPLQSHPLPGDCMSSLAQMSFGPPEPPYEEIGKKVPPIRNLFAIELASYTATAAMDSTFWGLLLRNVSCMPHNVKRAIIDGEESSTTPIPTHVCDGRKYATGSALETGFEPDQVSDCALAKEDPCICLTLKDCEWQPGSGDVPGGCAATVNPGVSCQACPFQEKCQEPDQAELCKAANNGCECAFTKTTSLGYGCVWTSGSCIARPTARSAATSCDACPTQIRCGTPIVSEITPDAGTLMGEQGVWVVQVRFDRPVYAIFQSDDTGIAMRCNTWEPAGGTTFRMSTDKLKVVENYLEIDLRNEVSNKRITCYLSLATNVIRSVRSNLPYGGLNDGNYFVFLPDTEEPTVDAYNPPNSARGLGRSVEVTFTFTEPLSIGNEPSARHVDLFVTGNVANAGQLVESIGFTDGRVSIKNDMFKVQLTGLEPSKFYSVVLPPLSLSDRSGNNFTGIPRNFYVFGTSSDSTVDDVDWSESMFLVLGIALVSVCVLISGVVGYLVMRSGRQNAKVFAKQVRTKSKGATQGDAMAVEDLDDGFYTKPALVEAGKSEGNTKLDPFRHVSVAWDTPKQGLDSSTSLSLSMSRSGFVSEGMQVQNVPSTSPRVSASPRPSASPRLGLEDEGWGSRSGSQVAALHAQRGSGSLMLPAVENRKGQSPKEKDGGRAMSKSYSKTSVHSFTDERTTGTTVRPSNERAARPRAPGAAHHHQGPQLPSEPSPELAGVSKALDRGNSKNLSGSWKGPLYSSSLAGAAGASSALAESAAVSRSMSKALRSNSRPLSRGQQTPVRPNH